MQSSPSSSPSFIFGFYLTFFRIVIFSFSLSLHCWWMWCYVLGHGCVLVHAFSYENNGSANEESFFVVDGQPGWFNTGDMGHLDEQVNDG